MKTVLITGANKSIGLETARQLLQQGYYVYLGCRDMEKGLQAISQLQSEGLSQVEPIEIDVDQIESIKAAREVLGRKTKVLDVLIKGKADVNDPARDPSRLTPLHVAVYEADPRVVERLLAAGADLAWFPSVCPETYSYTLSTILTARIYPVAFDIGAIAARLRDAGWGELMPLRRMLDPEWTAERLAELPILKSPARLQQVLMFHTYPEPLASYYELPEGLLPSSGEDVRRLNGRSASSRTEESPQVREPCNIGINPGVTLRPLDI